MRRKNGGFPLNLYKKKSENDFFTFKSVQNKEFTIEGNISID